MKKLLPIPHIPTKTFIYSASLGVIVNNENAAYDWESLNCLKLWYIFPNGLDFPEVLKISKKMEIPFLRRFNKYNGEYYTIIQSKDSIINYLKCEIDQGHYIYLFVEQYYIPGLGAYKRYRYQHDCLVYGYDDEKKCFLILTYALNKQFDSLNVSYDDMTISIIKNNGSRRFFISCMPRHSNFALNVNDIYFFLSIYGNVTSNSDQSIKMNLGVYESLIELVVMSWNYELDLRSYRLLVEHIASIEYIIDRLIVMLPNENFLAEKKLAQCCLKQSHLLFMLVIKYNVKKDENLRHNIVNKLQQLYGTERDLINILTDKLISHIK